MNQKNDNFTFEKFCDLMDQNIKGVQIGCYSIAIIGLTYALRRVRPFTQFKRPSDIPARFIKEQRELIGTVERVEPNSVLLLKHKPLISLPGVRQGELPIKIANVEVNGHGISWLQTLVAGNEVTFIPVSKKKEFVECQIKLQQQVYDKKEKKKERVIDLGVSLVSIGFGNLADTPINKKDRNYKYYMQLVSARENALRKKMGLKYYIKPTQLILAAIFHQFSVIINFLMKRILKKANVPKAIAA